MISVSFFLFKYTYTHICTQLKENPSVSFGEVSKIVGRKEREAKGVCDFECVHTHAHIRTYVRTYTHTHTIIGAAWSGVEKKHKKQYEEAANADKVG